MKSNKIINDILNYDLKIVQYTDEFKFSIDSVLLAEFVDIKLKAKNILDLCTGTGIIPLILSTKTNKKIYGLDINAKIIEAFKESIIINKLDNQLSTINDDLCNVYKYFESEFFDVVTFNPPYFINGLINGNDNKAMARHETKTDFELIIKSIKKILKNNGYIYFVHRPERLNYFLDILRINNFSVKRMQFIYSKEEKNAIMVLVEACKNGKLGLSIMPPVLINSDKNFKNFFKEE